MQRFDPGRASRTGKPCAGGQVGPGQAGGGALILGAIIAGGQARRFGSDKAEALLDGQALIEHVAAALRPHADAIVLCGRDRPGWHGLRDRPQRGLGPLGGIAAALHYAARRDYAHVLTIACDMPRLPDALFADLVAAAPAYCREAPILGCWPASLAAALDAHLARDADRSIRGWAGRVGASAIDSPSPLANINTPADLGAL